MTLSASTSRRLLALAAVMLFASATVALAADATGSSTATSLKEWLKLSDDQVEKLRPIIKDRVIKGDAALDKLEAGNPPNINAYLEERKEIKDEFQAKAKEILTPEQQKQMQELRVEIEKAFVQESAAKSLSDMQVALNLSDEQVKKIEPAVTSSTQGTLDLLQELGAKGKLEKSDIDAATAALDKIGVDLDKAVTGVLTPDQLETYKKLVAGDVQ